MVSSLSMCQNWAPENTCLKFRQNAPSAQKRHNSSSLSLPLCRCDACSDYCSAALIQRRTSSSVIFPHSSPKRRNWASMS